MVLQLRLRPTVGHLHFLVNEALFDWSKRAECTPEMPVSSMRGGTLFIKNLQSAPFFPFRLTHPSVCSLCSPKVSLFSSPGYIHGQGAMRVANSKESVQHHDVNMSQLLFCICTGFHEDIRALTAKTDDHVFKMSANVKGQKAI